ncbi:MAG: undecaprenyl/decaprenyl-phosphate alpha-N-acetylglucosaminyl 1-phosphate transferase [Acidobacteria bacterium]|nr:undecaprenyl/decaprenyl-phosphate alpha-N-acetylglucosaminyl 1-phosphate transferase [Acidobacteriota bacterium]
MRTYLTLFTLSFLGSLLITPFVRRKATEWGAIAMPDNGRHIHLRPTPLLGGVAIYLAFTLTLLCVPFLGNLVTDIFRANLPKLIALLVPATFIFFLGIYDDFRSASAPVKIFFQLIAASMVYAGGLRIENLSSPFGGTWELPMLLSFPLTALWIVIITNAFNLIDGIDGLAAGASVFALLSILVFSIAQLNPEISLISVVLVGAVIGFLRYNLNPATIFLGDSGSLFLGFMAAALSLAGSQKGSTIIAIAIPLVSFGLPVTEAGLSLVRRFLGGRPLFAGDRGHIHHMLLQRGLTQPQVVILLYAVCALFSLFGLMLLNPKRNIGALIFFVLGVAFIFGVQHLRYAEFSELGSQIKQEVSRRRRALAVNVRVRRTSDGLGSAKTPDQLFAALEEMLSTNEFDCTILELSEKAPLIASYSMRYCAYPVNRTSSNVIWVWERGDTDLEEILNSDQFWTLRVPLTDEEGKTLGAIIFYRCLLDGTPTVEIGHLCGDLQRELSSALLRMTGAGVKG